MARIAGRKFGDGLGTFAGDEQVAADVDHLVDGHWQALTLRFDRAAIDIDFSE